jgi:hypothetical protein
MAARLFVLLAREAPVAVVFRRGPSKRVALLRWSTGTDQFETGQWLKGRIYERRCDLSPSGDRLIYFAANWKMSYGTWTAVSRPPWLTALALWRNGEAWGGGGLFEDEDTIALNHRAAGPPDKGRVPHPIRVGLFPGAGSGEDWPIYGARLARDGWTLVQTGIYARPSPIDSGMRLEMRILQRGQRQGPWYRIDHALISGGGEAVLADTDWADWDRNGDLLYARDGCLYRAPRGDLANMRQLIDLNGLAFEARPSPESARHWND